MSASRDSERRKEIPLDGILCKIRWIAINQRLGSFFMAWRDKTSRSRGLRLFFGMRPDDSFRRLVVMSPYEHKKSSQIPLGFQGFRGVSLINFDKYSSFRRIGKFSLFIVLRSISSVQIVTTLRVPYIFSVLFDY